MIIKATSAINKKTEKPLILIEYEKITTIYLVGNTNKDTSLSLLELICFS